jgi:gluconolactonase
MALRRLTEVEIVAGGFSGGLDHPEGVTWGPDGHAYAGGEVGQIYRVDVGTGRFEQIGCSEGFICGVACDAEANVYACNVGASALVRVMSDGSQDVVSQGTAERPMETPNYPCFHPSGDLYVSDSGEWEQGNGRIYRVRPDGVTELFSEAPRLFPNGMCLSPDGDWLYVVESNLPGVSRLRIDPAGLAGERELVATLPGDVPDGVQFDVDGNLYICLYVPSRIYRQEPSGRIEVLVEDPNHTTLASPTNIVFGGPDRRDLLISSLGRWHIARLRMEAPGIPLAYPPAIQAR